MEAGEGEADVDGFVEIIRAADGVSVVPRAAVGDVPVRLRVVGHEGVDVRVDGAGYVPFVCGQAAGNDVGVEGEEEAVGLRGDGGERGDGEVSGAGEGEECSGILLDGGEGGGDVVLEVGRDGFHGLGNVGELGELGVEGAEGEEVFADGDGLLGAVEDGADDGTDGRGEEAEADG